MSNETYSILVRNVCKKYFFGTECVLNGLNMTIRAGSTYGLLGSSGCGKTTLLKCLLGQLDIDSGTIQISATKYKQIGYMPQAVSLHEELTLEELFKYYGSIYSMSDNFLSNRVQELSDLFEFPSIDRQVAVCSGGEKLRISLAVTFLHNPDILLLDEPTAGLDPLLSNKIMKYFISLSVNEGKTILITTHYMEEAKTLHTVGLMRDGTLLEEAPPEDLITKYNCNTLDDVFISVINSRSSDKEIGGSRSSKRAIKETPRLKTDQTICWNHLQAVLYRNYIWSVRSLGVTLITFSLPLMNLFVFLYGFSNDNTPNGIGYYNEELRHGNCSMKNAVMVDECPPSTLYSCQFIDLVKQKLVIRDFNSLDDGMNALRYGETYGMLYIPKNFSQSLSSRMTFRILDIDDVLEDQQAQIWFDTTDYFNAVRAKTDLYYSLKELIRMKCEKCGIDNRLSYVIKEHPNLFGGDNFSHLSGWIPGLITGILFFSAYHYTAAIFTTMKLCGVLERDHMNGLTNAEILCGIFIIQFLVAIFHTVTCMITTFGIFEEPCIGRYIWIFILLVLNQLIGFLIGILAGLSVTQEYLITIFGLGLYFCVLVVNGVLWPVQGIHWLLKHVSSYLPIVMITESYTNVSHRGYGITHHRVYPGLINGIVTILVSSSLIYLKIRLNNNQL